MVAVTSIGSPATGEQPPPASHLPPPSLGRLGPGDIPRAWPRGVLPAFAVIAFTEALLNQPGPLLASSLVVVAGIGAVANRRYGRLWLTHRRQELELTQIRAANADAERQLALYRSPGVVVCECGHSSSYHAAEPSGGRCRERDRQHPREQCRCQNSQERVVARFCQDR